MERLTGWDKEYAYCVACFDRNPGGCEDMGTSKCDSCERPQAVYQKLAAYEDTGLTPEEVAFLKTSIGELREEVNQIYVDQKFVKMLQDEGKIDVDATITRAFDLMEADAAGRLVMLPCKVGESFYGIRKVGESFYGIRKSGNDPCRIVESTIIAFVINDIGVMVYSDNEFPVRAEDIDGKYLFATREAAEAALKAQED